MDQVNNGAEIPQSTNPDLDRRVRTFTSGLRKDVAAEIAQSPSIFRSRVVGKIRAMLPRQRPGRKGSPEVRKAAEIYQSDYKSKGKKGDWDQISRQVYADYANLPSYLQKFRRFELRSGVHSYLYEYRSRERRTKRKLSKASHAVAQEGGNY